MSFYWENCAPNSWINEYWTVSAFVCIRSDTHLIFVQNTLSSPYIDTSLSSYKIIEKSDEKNQIFFTTIIIIIRTKPNWVKIKWKWCDKWKLNHWHEISFVGIWMLCVWKKRIKVVSFKGTHLCSIRKCSLKLWSDKVRKEFFFGKIANSREKHWK